MILPQDPLPSDLPLLLLKQQWEWCHFCNGGIVSCLECGATSCNGGGCKRCDLLFSLANQHCIKITKRMCYAFEIGERPNQVAMIGHPIVKWPMGMRPCVCD